ncbi:GvpL/GvpF family gas vesicle protein [Oceanobacillus kapialis]|uniref:GvpL/GvpF family gas vesicle protein n=1 Tax=Oceanobacillus kapialis TaxID=481353 RepID=A0ABW5PXS5_9BACI
MNGTETGIYIFCAVQTNDPHDFGTVEIDGTSRETFAIQYEDAAMIACEAPLKIYHPNKENLMMHQAMVSKAMEEHDTVIPISFGNVFKSEKDVEILLQNLYSQFTEIFPEIKGKIEVGLKVIGNKEWIEKQVNNNPELQEMALTAKGKSAAAGYYDRIKLGGAAKSLITSLRQDVEENIYLPLKSQATAAVSNETQGEKILLNASFLINREDEERFDKLVNEQHEQWKDKVSFQYTGPWPAYNFINIRLSVEKA